MKKFLKVLLVGLLILVAVGATAGLVRNRTTDKTCKHELESSAAVEPTCTQDGHTGDITCKICGEKLLDGDILPALGHTPVEIPAVDPTCTQTGLTAGSKCTRCGEVLTEQEVIPVLDHTPEEIPAVAPTCTQTGLTAGNKCTRCGEVLTAQEVIPVLDHTPEEIPAVAPTCTQTGLAAGSRCAHCGEVLTAQEVIPVLDHTPEEIPAVAPTCTQKGSTAGSRCAHCGEVLTAQEVIPTLDHTPEEVPAVASTCTQTGLTTGSKCARCSEVLIEQEAVPALGHESVTAVAGKQATCLEDGYTAVTKCNRCDVLLQNQTKISAYGHSFLIAATCTSGRKCIRCSETSGPALGHTFGEWNYTTQTPCCEEKSRECEACGKIETSFTQLQNHVQEKNGYHCEHCGKTLVTVSGRTITGCDSALEELTIYYPAVGIADYAFAGKNLRDVKIKTDLESVGAYAFFGCYEDLRIALYTDYGANSHIEKWDPEWYYGNGDFETPFYYYTTTEPVVTASEVTNEGS